ncbi:uncharacterized protein LOC110980566 [Acanthaster planci]|uniref:Uncharacterized protein LOC110980566 n=1 Tax=Acanthaster planci TaxID=133434 RepID=A0A8B7YKC6_ACAPL|nr:uncharacterized protein LOC110980566 [Acanthaster planci]
MVALSTFSPLILVFLEKKNNTVPTGLGVWMSTCAEKMPKNMLPTTICEILIALVKDNPTLYDVRDKDHKNAAQIARIWKRIADQINYQERDGDYWKKRWRMLRDTYVRKRRTIKTKKSRRDASRAAMWRFYEMMDFLASHTDQNVAGGTISGQNDTVVTLEVEEINDEDALDLASIGEGSDRIDLVEKSSCTIPFLVNAPLSHSKRPSRKRNKDRQDLVGAFPDPCGANTGGLRASSPPAKDEDEMFFEIYARRLKQLPPHLKSVVQFQIAQLFFNAENPHLPQQAIMPLP